MAQRSIFKEEITKLYQAFQILRRLLITDVSCAGGFPPGMGMYGQPPAAFPPGGPEGGGGPPEYGWFWGLVGGPGGSVRSPPAAAGPARAPSTGGFSYNATLSSYSQPNRAVTHVLSATKFPACSPDTHFLPAPAGQPMASGAPQGFPPVASRTHATAPGRVLEQKAPASQGPAQSPAVRPVQAPGSTQHPAAIAHAQPATAQDAASHAHLAHAAAGQAAHALPAAGQPAAGHAASAEAHAVAGQGPASHHGEVSPHGASLGGLTESKAHHVGLPEQAQQPSTQHAQQPGSHVQPEAEAYGKGQEKRGVAPER